MDAESPDLDVPRPRLRFPVRRAAGVLALAVAFGITIAWIKGNGAGVRDAIGNVSALWLLLPFAAGVLTTSRRPAAGAVVGAAAGLAATLAALTGFYFAESFVLDLGSHPWLTDLSLTMGTVFYYGERGLVTGPVFGALGYLWGRHGWRTAAALLAAVFVLEPAAWWLYNRRLGGGAAYPVPGYPAVWLTEIALGIGGFAVLTTMARRGWNAGR
jgi:hypothetical protein